MDLISVIIPVYNVEAYVRRCLDSVITQTYGALEIILIDDGSTDQSGKICDEYAKKDSRICVIHKKNGGLSAARNQGIDIATGKYLAFIDSDDYIFRDYFKNLLLMMKQYQAGVAVCLLEKFYGECHQAEMTFEIKDTLKFDSRSALEDMLYRKNMNSYACGKLFLKELWNDIRFPVGKLFEDVWTLYKVYNLAEVLAFNKGRMYFYFQRSGSIVNSTFRKEKLDQVKATEEIFGFVKEKYPDIQCAASSKLLISAIDIYRRIPDKKNYAEELQYVKRVIKEHRKRVLYDKKNKPLTRMIALAACICMPSLRVAAQVYEKILSSGLVKIKNPI